MLVTACKTAPPVLADAWTDRWEGPDRGLFACWIRGQEYAVEYPKLAVQAKAGQLVVLPWRGGVEKPVKVLNKIGSLNYLAMWQGMRGEDLSVSLVDDLTLKCTLTRVPVRFTPNLMAELATQVSKEESP